MATVVEKQARRWTCKLHCAAEVKGKLNSLVVAGLEFDLAEIQ
jgi:hypothetical protein